MCPRNIVFVGSGSTAFFSLRLLMFTWQINPGILFAGCGTHAAGVYAAKGVQG